MDPQFIPTQQHLRDTMNVLEYLMTTIMEQKGPKEIVEGLNFSYAFINSVIANEPPDQIVI